MFFLRTRLVPAPRSTQKQIAEQLGLTQAAVSMALRDHPRIGAGTRAKVRALSEKLGYVPDPFLSGLSAYRKRRRPSGFHGTLAWLSNYPQGRSWRQIPEFAAYHAGAERCARELGYVLEEHHLRAPGMTNQRMRQILIARRIDGIIVAPQPEPGVSLSFPFDSFCAVSLGYSLAKPNLNIVTGHHFRSFERGLQNLFALGYRRPGLALHDRVDERTNRIWSSAFWSRQRDLPAADQVPPLLGRPLTEENLLRWFRATRPDVIITIVPEALGWLRSAGVQVPGEVGFALLNLPSVGSVSGNWANPEVIGKRAVETVVDMMHRGERGIPEIPTCVMVEGTWHQGRTLRRAPRTTKKRATA